LIVDGNPLDKDVAPAPGEISIVRPRHQELARRGVGGDRGALNRRATGCYEHGPADLMTGAGKHADNIFAIPARHQISPVAPAIDDGRRVPRVEAADREVVTNQFARARHELPQNTGALERGEDDQVAFMYGVERDAGRAVELWKYGGDGNRIAEQLAGRGDALPLEILFDLIAPGRKILAGSAVLHDSPVGRWQAIRRDRDRNSGDRANMGDELSDDSGRLG
jgi:hypothetical protein